MCICINYVMEGTYPEPSSHAYTEQALQLDAKRRREYLAELAQTLGAADAIDKFQGHSQVGSRQVGASIRASCRARIRIIRLYEDYTSVF